MNSIIDDDFNEESARQLVEFLLSNDIKIFKKFLSYIKKMDYTPFRELFRGNKQYKYSIGDNSQFEQLIIKFYNYNSIIEELYEEPENYKYLLELWTHYIWMEDLKGKSEDQIKEILMKTKINYSNWPENIKQRFNKCLDSTSKNENSTMNKFREILSNLPSLFKLLLNKLNIFSNKCFSENKKEFGQIALHVCKLIIENSSGIEIQNIRIIPKIIEDVWSNSKIKNISFEKIGKIIKKRKKIYRKMTNSPFYVFFQMGYSVYNLYSAYNEYQEIKDFTHKITDKMDYFDKELENIENDIQLNRILIKNFVSTNKCTIENFSSKLNDLVEKVNNDLSKIKNLIKEIKQYIEFIKQKSEKEKVEFYKSLFQSTAGFVSGYFSNGFSSFLNVLSGIINGGTAYLHHENINSIEANYKRLEEQLKRAEKDRAEIEDEMQTLKNFVEENEDAAPTFYDNNI